MGRYFVAELRELLEAIQSIVYSTKGNGEFQRPARLKIRQARRSIEQCFDVEKLEHANKIYCEMIVN